MIKRYRCELYRDSNEFLDSDHDLAWAVHLGAPAAIFSCLCEARSTSPELDRSDSYFDAIMAWVDWDWCWPAPGCHFALKTVDNCQVIYSSP